MEEFWEVTKGKGQPNSDVSEYQGLEIYHPEYPFDEWTVDTKIRGSTGSKSLLLTLADNEWDPDVIKGVKTLDFTPKRSNYSQQGLQTYVTARSKLKKYPLDKYLVIAGGKAMILVRWDIYYERQDDGKIIFTDYLYWSPELNDDGSPAFNFKRYPFTKLNNFIRAERRGVHKKHEVKAIKAKQNRIDAKMFRTSWRWIN